MPGLLSLLRYWSARHASLLPACPAHLPASKICGRSGHRLKRPTLHRAEAKPIMTHGPFCLWRILPKSPRLIVTLARGPTMLRKASHRGGTCWCNTIKRRAAIQAFCPRSIFTRMTPTASSPPRPAGATPISSPRVGPYPCGLFDDACP
jgi:hypothetical protein